MTLLTSVCALSGLICAMAGPAIAVLAPVWYLCMWKFPEPLSRYYIVVGMLAALGIAFLNVPSAFTAALSLWPS